MQLVIKVLKGQDCTLNVESHTTILEIKKEIEKLRNIPITNQKLLFIGRTLNDNNEIKNYPLIKEGSKLHLIVAATTQFNIDEAAYRTFRKHYNDVQADRLSKRFVEDFQKQLSRMNLDDLERIANQLAEQKK